MRAREEVRDESGALLWRADYPFRRLNGPGETFTRDSVEYVVVSSEKVGPLIRTVVRLTNPSPDRRRS